MLHCRTIYLLQALALAHANVIQPHHSKLAPAERTITILEKITDNSANEVCSYPAISVLQDLQTFTFFKECNRQLPTQFSPHSSSEDILCMGLYEIGMRLCSVVTKYKLSQTFIPSKPSDFLKFINDPHEKEANAKLCTEFGNFSTSSTEQNESLEAWNTLRIFKNKPQACSQICLYINGDAKELCRLILLGNRLLFFASQEITKQSVHNLSASKMSNLEVKDKSVDVTSENHNNRVPETEGEQSSPSEHEAKYPSSNDELSPGVSSQVSSKDNSQNATPPKNIKVTDDQKSDADHNVNDAKQPLPENLSEGDNSQIPDQLDHPEPVYSSADHKELPNNSENKKETKPVVEETKILKKENAGDNLGSKLQDKGNQEANMGEPAAKVATSAPVPKAVAPEAPIAHESPVAPEAPDEIVQNTASNPIIDQDLGNQEPVGPEDSSKYYDQEQDIDEDGNFPPKVDDQPTKAEEANNGDGESKLSDDVTYVHGGFEDSEDSHFFRYFMTMVVICIFGYLLFHNKQKILALFLEGRSRRGTRRRPNTANYHKLDCNLEEAVSSPCSTSVAHVIY